MCGRADIRMVPLSVELPPASKQTVVVVVVVLVQQQVANVSPVEAASAAERTSARFGPTASGGERFEF